jgi:hypothetical protein
MIILGGQMVSDKYLQFLTIYSFYQTFTILFQCMSWRKWSIVLHLAECNIVPLLCKQFSEFLQSCMDEL